MYRNAFRSMTSSPWLARCAATRPSTRVRLVQRAQLDVDRDQVRSSAASRRATSRSANVLPRPKSPSTSMNRPWSAAELAEHLLDQVVARRRGRRLQLAEPLRHVEARRVAGSALQPRGLPGDVVAQVEQALELGEAAQPHAAAQRLSRSACGGRRALVDQLGAVGAGSWLQERVDDLAVGSPRARRPATAGRTRPRGGDRAGAAGRCRRGGSPRPGGGPRRPRRPGCSSLAGADRSARAVAARLRPVGLPGAAGLNVPPVAGHGRASAARGLAGSRAAVAPAAQPVRGDAQDLARPGRPRAAPAAGRRASSALVPPGPGPCRSRLSRGPSSRSSVPASRSVRRVGGPPDAPGQRVVPDHPDPQPAVLLVRGAAARRTRRPAPRRPAVVVLRPVALRPWSSSARRPPPQVRHGEQRPGLRVSKTGRRAPVELVEQPAEAPLGPVRRAGVAVPASQRGSRPGTPPGHVPRCRDDDQPARVEAEQHPQPGEERPAPRRTRAAGRTRSGRR